MRAVLSLILPKVDGTTFGNLPLVIKFMKGVSNIRPVFPKYSSVWVVKVLLDRYRLMPDNGDLPLKDLILKLTVLLCCVLHQRAQTIHTFDIR